MNSSVKFCDQIAKTTFKHLFNKRVLRNEDYLSTRNYFYITCGREKIQCDFYKLNILTAMHHQVDFFDLITQDSIIEFNIQNEKSFVELFEDLTCHLNDKSLYLKKSIQIRSHFTYPYICQVEQYTYTKSASP
jgi:hypothetical protein